MQSPVEELDALLQFGELLPGPASRVPKAFPSYCRYLGSPGCRIRAGGLVFAFGLRGAIALSILVRKLVFLKLEQVDSDGQLADNYAEPRGLGESRAVDGEAEAADFNLEAIARGVGESPQGEVTDALDRDTGDDAKDGENHERGEV